MLWPLTELLQDMPLESAHAAVGATASRPNADRPGRRDSSSLLTPLFRRSLDAGEVDADSRGGMSGVPRTRS
jgi:hypothetical protein